MRDLQILRALRHRNFRLFFFGQSVSLIGTWMQQVGMSWLVYNLVPPESGKQAFYLGLVTFCSLAPSFFVAPIAGVFTDRWNLHRTILLTQFLAMVQALLLVGISLTGVATVSQVILLSVFLGVVTAFDVPARQSFLIHMVEGRENLASAIGLNSSMFNGARIIGPLIAGVLIQIKGPWLCFLFNAVSYLAVLLALMSMRVTPRVASKPPQRVLHELREGFRYAFGFIPIRILLLLVSTVSLTSTALWVLLPVFTKDVLGGESVTFSIMTAAIGLGALGGALSLASRKSVLGLGRIIAWAGGAFVVGLLGVSMSKSIWFAIPFLVVTGFAMMVQTTASNTILQTIVDDEKRGRVMSFYAMAFLGTAPLGGIMAGSVAHWLGVVGTIQAAAAICLLGTATFAWKLPALREIIRPIYRRIGIIPVGTELASGIPSATAEWAITSERNGVDPTRSG